MSGIVAVDHVGVAVHSLTEARRLYEDVLGLACLGEELLPGMGVKILKFRAGESTVELIQAMAPDSVVGRFLATRGEGVHHVCYRVDDLSVAVARLQSKGYQPLWSEPKIGAGGSRVHFLHPKRAHGSLIELAETGPARH